MDLDQLAATTAIGEGDDLAGAVGKVDHGLMVGGEWESKHFYLGGEGGRLPSHDYKINQIDQKVNRYLYPNRFWLSDLDENAILKGADLVGLSKITYSLAIIGDNDYHERGLVDHTTVGRPATSRLDHGMACWKITGRGDQGKGSAFVDGQLGRL